jgi:superfamily II DNA or RNA helicase
VQLRKHQKEFIFILKEILQGKPIREIICSVCPGGGKSFLGVIAAINLIPIISKKIVWVVPRNSLKYQAEEEFLNPLWGTKIRVRAADNNSYDLFKGCDGYITTYQAISANPDVHLKTFQEHRPILLLDEFHHIAEGSEWHKAIKPLVDAATLVVLASGTLSRGDGNKIAFLRYISGKPYLDNNTTRRVIQYSRSAAIADGTIMPVQFHLVDGNATWEEMDGHRNTSALSGEESAKALFTALRTEFADHLLNISLREFTEISYIYREATMLVVAPNIEIAKTYYDYLARRGHKVRIATSEDTPQARRNIQDFKRGVFHILVTVAMAYEGLNVPSISVICCLSHIRSVPWLEQCFARANRIKPGKKKAIVFAPADWAFKKAVKMIEQEQLVPLENPDNQQELLSQGERQEGKGEAKPWIIPVSSSASNGVSDAPPPIDLPPCSPSEAEKILRKNINGVITLFLENTPHGNKQTQSKMLYRSMKLQCGKPIKEMNQSELEKVWLWVRKEYGKGVSV